MKEVILVNKSESVIIPDLVTDVTKENNPTVVITLHDLNPTMHCFGEIVM